MFFQPSKEVREIDVTAKFRRCVSSVILDQRLNYTLPIVKHRVSRIEEICSPCRAAEAADRGGPRHTRTGAFTCPGNKRC